MIKFLLPYFKFLWYFCPQWHFCLETYSFPTLIHTFTQRGHILSTYCKQCVVDTCVNCMNCLKYVFVNVHVYVKNIFYVLFFKIKYCLQIHMNRDQFETGLVAGGYYTSDISEVF